VTMPLFKKVSSKNSHLDETYEVVQLESKSESERRAKFRQLSPGKLSKYLKRRKKIFLFFLKKEFHQMRQVMRIMMKQ